MKYFKRNPNENTGHYENYLSGGGVDVNYY